MNLPKYTSKDYQVLLWVVVPFTLILNTFIFGQLYYNNLVGFVSATLITAVACCIDFILCGFVAVELKHRFPKEKQMATRLSLMIVIFITFTGLFLFSLFKGYEMIGFYNYTFNEVGFIWSYVAMGILNIFLTFLHEGISRYEEWKANLKETEQVRMSYRKSQLLGLKSQINPHFLFNSLNTLSSLISEDEKAAEKFLDEMSKIYRYMLRNDDEQLVSLQTELSFIHSYFYLLNTRYSCALNLNVNVSEDDKLKGIPPLTLQMIVENSIACNAFSKCAPLDLAIEVEGSDLVIRNTVQRKIGNELVDSESLLNNLIEKYQVLHQTPIRISSHKDERVIRVPLITMKQRIAV